MASIGTLPRSRTLRDWIRPLDVKGGVLALFRWSWIGIAVAGVLAFSLVSEGMREAMAALPRVPTLPDIPPPAENTRLVDVNGKTIAYLHGEENRVLLPPDRIPQAMRDAVIAIEDHTFFEHNGVSLQAMMRALTTNLQEGTIAQGGSTITQQYVRNAIDSVGREQSLERKVREAMLAMKLESEMPKDEILDRYLNTVYFGRGAYGVQAAAKGYFGKNAWDLEVHEAAFLAGVIQTPGRYSRDREAGKERRDLVIGRMRDLGFISPDEARAAREEELKIRKFAPPRVRAAYFVEHVRRLLKTPTKFGGFGLTDEDILTGGLTVHTTLDLRMQKAAERAVKRVLNRKKDPEAAMVAMTTDGQIRAMIGGRDFSSTERARGFNHATQISKRGGGRQVGSTFKPFTLAAWIDQGRSPRTVFPAPARAHISNCGAPGDPWRPANYGDQGFGSLDTIAATEKSVNTVFAQMVARSGPKATLRMARKAGITAPLEPVCSITLGVFGVTALEMARGYATFAARGARPEVLAVTKIEDRDGNVLAERKVKRKQTIRKRTADTVNKILERVMTNGTGTPARISRPAAGKTGTTEDRRDVWFAGYTPHPGLSAAVWIGYPPNKKGRIPVMRTLHGRPATGGYFAGRIWKYFMEEALEGTKVRTFRSVSLGSYSRTSETRTTVTTTRRIVPRPRARREPKRETTGTREETVSTETEPETKPKPKPSPSEDSSPSPEPTSSTASDDDDETWAMGSPEASPAGSEDPETVEADDG